MAENIKKISRINTKIGTINAFYIINDDYYTIKLCTFISNEEIGFATFKFSEKRRANVWLQNIKIKEKFQSKGLGKVLIKMFENFCYDKRRYIIEGKFYPENNHSKTFYENNGYSIEKEYYETFIYKDLRFEKSKNCNQYIEKEY